MTLYLVRHAKAIPSHAEGDSYRTLSEKGVSRARELVDSAGKRGMKPDLILTSPYARARATAEIFSVLAPGLPLRLSSSFLPESELQSAFGELLGWYDQGFSHIAVFTHNPFVSSFADYLTEPKARRFLMFHAPTIAAIEFSNGFHPGQGCLAWIEHPDEKVD